MGKPFDDYLENWIYWCASLRAAIEYYNHSPTLILFKAIRFAQRKVCLAERGLFVITFERMI